MKFGNLKYACQKVAAFEISSSDLLCIQTKFQRSLSSVFHFISHRVLNSTMRGIRCLELILLDPYFLLMDLCLCHYIFLRFANKLFFSPT